MTTETTVLRRVWLRLSRVPGVALFRNNCGTGWAGKLMSKIGGRKSFTVMIENARPLHAGLHRGSSDLIGWRSITITPSMIGLRVAVFTAIETKSERGRARENQLHFIKQVRQAGGIAGIVSTPEQALALLNHPRPGVDTGGPAGGD